MPSSTPGSCFQNVNTSCVYTDLLFFFDFRLGRGAGSRGGWALCALRAPAPCELALGGRRVARRRREVETPSLLKKSLDLPEFL